MSAKSDTDIEALLDIIESKLSGGYQECKLLIPYNRGDIVSFLNDNAVIYTTEYNENGVYLKSKLKKEYVGKYEEFIIKS